MIPLPVQNEVLKLKYKAGEEKVWLVKMWGWFCSHIHVHLEKNLTCV